MFTNSYIQVSNSFIIIIESTLKFTKDAKNKIFGNPIFEMKIVTYSGLIYKYYSHSKLRMSFKDFFNLVLEARDFFSTIRVVSFTTCKLSINLLKYLFISFQDSHFLRKFVLIKLILCVI